MLADSLDPTLSAVLHTALFATLPAPPPHPGTPAGATGWLVFLLLIGAASVLPAVLAAIARRLLPPDPRLGTPLEPVSFGDSPRVLRSPRHAVRAHRALVASVCAIGLALVLVAYATASRALGLGGLVVAIAFVVPMLLVALHARRREPRREPRRGGYS